jgi:hypothetical protein
MYRAYSCDSVIEIVDYADSIIGLAARKVMVEWHPQANAETNTPEGMRFLTGLPTTSAMKPLKFKKGVRV